MRAAELREFSWPVDHMGKFLLIVSFRLRQIFCGVGGPAISFNSVEDRGDLRDDFPVSGFGHGAHLPVGLTSYFHRLESLIFRPYPLAFLETNLGAVVGGISNEQPDNTFRQLWRFLSRSS